MARLLGVVVLLREPLEGAQRLLLRRVVVGDGHAQVARDLDGVLVEEMLVAPRVLRAHARAHDDDLELVRGLGQGLGRLDFIF